jgi:hypothetical protein
MLVVVSLDNAIARRRIGDPIAGGDDVGAIATLAALIRAPTASSAVLKDCCPFADAIATASTAAASGASLASDGIGWVKERIVITASSAAS